MNDSRYNMPTPVFLTFKTMNLTDIELEIASIKHYLEYKAGGNEFKVNQKKARLKKLERERLILISKL